MQQEASYSYHNQRLQDSQQLLTRASTPGRRTMRRRCLINPMSINASVKGIKKGEYKEANLEQRVPEPQGGQAPFLNPIRQHLSTFHD